MKIGIVIAIERELKSFLENGFKIETIIVEKKEIYKARINDNEVYVAKSGCGLIDSASATQMLISCFGVGIILNFGVAGALRADMSVSDLFLVEKSVNYNFDLSSVDDLRIGQYEDFEDAYIPMDASLISKAKKSHPELRMAVVASGDKFVSSIKDKDHLRDFFGCDICDMEIASISRVSYLNGVKCLSIKCISDTLEGDGGDFAKNVETSSNKAFSFLVEIINSL